MRMRTVLVLGLIAPPLGAQSALGQLEGLTGQKVQRFQGSGAYRFGGGRGPLPTASLPRTPRLTPDQRAASLLTGLFGGLLSETLTAPSRVGTAPAPVDPAQADLEAWIARQKQEAALRDREALQAWAKDYSTQLNRQLLGPQGGSLEAQAAAQSGFWDGAPRPAGDSLAVDLRDARALRPGNLKEPPAPKAVTADDLLRRREEAQARLRRMMDENRDLKALGGRFHELEEELARLREEAARLGADGRQLQREHEAWGAQVDRAIQNTLERGASLLTGTLAPEGTARAFKKLRANPKAWTGTVEALSQVQDFTDFVTERADRGLAVRDAVDWSRAKHSLFENLDFLGTNLQHANTAWKPLSTQWELGKAIVGSGLDVAQELDAWAYQKGAAGDQALLAQRQKALQGRMAALVGQLQASRKVLADRLGLRPEDLIPVRLDPRGIGSPVPRL